MLSARAYSFRQQSKLAISLSWIGGYTNVITVLVCGAYTSHMTGNTTSFGKDLAESTLSTHRGAAGATLGGAAGTPAMYFGYLVLCFFLGAVLSAFMTEWADRQGRRSKYIFPMAAEAVLLTIFSIGVWQVVHHGAGGEGQSRWGLGAMTGLSAFAMGLQNATITKISGAIVRTTHLTGVITDLGLESVQYFLWFRDQSRGRSWKRRGRLLRLSQRHPTAQRLALLGSIWGSFIFGVVAGTYLFHLWQSVALWPPVAFLGWIIFMDWYRPIADVRQLDLLSDPELKLYGIMHELLPPELGIYRLSVHRHGGTARAPNFQLWADRLPDHWRIIIMALSADLRFDANATMDLEAARSQLMKAGKTLILCGVHPAQYQSLDTAGLIDKIGIENVCPDLEFAIARGIELTRPLRSVALE